MLIINIIALICSLFFLCTKRKLWTFRFDLYCNTLCQFRPPG